MIFPRTQGKIEWEVLRRVKGGSKRILLLLLRWRLIVPLCVQRGTHMYAAAGNRSPTPSLSAVCEAPQGRQMSNHLSWGVGQVSIVCARRESMDALWRNGQGKGF